jgi:hypothetical protein
MEPLRLQKKVQKLTSCMVALSHFISRLGEKGMSFYKLLVGGLRLTKVLKNRI